MAPAAADAAAEVAPEMADSTPEAAADVADSAPEAAAEVADSAPEVASEAALVALSLAPEVVDSGAAELAAVVSPPSVELPPRAPAMLPEETVKVIRSAANPCLRETECCKLTELETAKGGQKLNSLSLRSSASIGEDLDEGSVADCASCSIVWVVDLENSRVVRERDTHGGDWLSE